MKKNGLMLISKKFLPYVFRMFMWLCVSYVCVCDSLGVVIYLNLKEVAYG